MANRVGSGRPEWVSISDWLAVQERAQELRDQRLATRRLTLATSQARLDPDELDWAWRQDTPNWNSTNEPASGSRTPRIPPPRRKLRDATCRACGHTWQTCALRPSCSQCHRKGITVGDLADAA